MILYRLIKRFKSSDFIQGAMLLILSASILFYSYLLLVDCYTFHDILDYNESCISLDSSLVNVTGYTINTNGSAIVDLESGIQYKQNNLEIVFINRSSDNRCYFSTESSTLICEVSSDYGLNYLWGTDYIIILLFNMIWFVLVIMIRGKDFSLLSESYIAGFVFFTLVIQTAVGVIIATSF